MLRHGETITRLRAPKASDPYSQTAQEPDWTHAAEVDIAGCVVYPAATTAAEVYDVGRDKLMQILTLLAPAGTDLTAYDRVRVRGQVYEVTGAVWRQVLALEVEPSADTEAASNCGSTTTPKAARLA